MALYFIIIIDNQYQQFNGEHDETIRSLSLSI